MGILKIILTLLISAVIGYLTNYIAVKMLFRPLKPIYIKGHKVPFTPGIIPKGKPRLAKALGNAVSDTLLTNDDITKVLLSDDVKKSVAEDICRTLYNGDGSLKATIADTFGDDTYDKAKSSLSSLLTEKIYSGIEQADIGSIIISEGSSAIREKTQGTMMAMFVTDDLIMSLAQPVGEKINEYLAVNSRDKISAMVNSEVEKLENQSAGEVLCSLDIGKSTLEKIVCTVYSSVVSTRLGEMLSNLDIRKIVENKVNEMDVSDLEELVMSVMKNELNAIINLGAVIGFVIGILNVLVQLI